MIRILGLWTDWGDNEYRKLTGEYGGLGYYRIAKPLLALQAAYPDQYQVDIVGPEFRTRFGRTLEEIFTNIFSQYDIVFSKQIDNAAASSALLAAAEHFNKRVVFDLDDNHFAAREDTAAGEVYGFGKERRYYVAAEISLATAVAVSTQPLKEVYGEIQQNVSVLPNCNDTGDWLAQPKKRDDGKIRIGYMGSITHNHDFEMVIEPLKAVLQKYPHVELELLGLMTRDTFRQYKKKFRSVKGKVTNVLGTPSWKGYPELLAERGWDIGIAPLTQDDFNRCKSHIKWMEYSMVGVPVVASKVYPYFQDIQGTHTIVHGETGRLATTPDEWVYNLTALIESAEERQRLAKNAYNYIQSHWQWSDHAHKWHEFFQQVMKLPCSSPIPVQKAA